MCAKSGRCCEGCYPGRVGRCKNFGNADLQIASATTGDSCTSGADVLSSDPPAWTRRCFPSSDRIVWSARSRAVGAGQQEAHFVSVGDGGVSVGDASLTPSHSVVDTSLATASRVDVGAVSADDQQHLVDNLQPKFVALPCAGAGDRRGMVDNLQPKCVALPSASAGDRQRLVKNGQPKFVALPSACADGQRHLEENLQPKFVTLPDGRSLPCSYASLSAASLSSMDSSTTTDFTRGLWAQPEADMRLVVQSLYNKVVHWKRNIMMVPLGASGREFVKEAARLVSSFSQASKWRSMAWALLTIACHLLLQKPLGSGRLENHAKCLHERIKMWRDGQVDDLLKDALCIQAHLKSGRRMAEREGEKPTDIEFSRLVFNGKINAAMRCLTEDRCAGTLRLGDIVSAEQGTTVGDVLQQKHPPARDAITSVLLGGEPEPHWCCFRL